MFLKTKNVSGIARISPGIEIIQSKKLKQSIILIFMIDCPRPKSIIATQLESKGVVGVRENLMLVLPHGKISN